jgi:FlaA1/EpsC-like NDP-sugar epimerase
MNKGLMWIKRQLPMGVDLALVLLTYALAILIRFDFSMTQLDPQGLDAIDYFTLIVTQIPVILGVYWVVFKLLKLDQTISGMASVYEATRVIIASVVGAALFFIIAQTGLIQRLRFGIYPIQALFLILFLEFVRFSQRLTSLVSQRNKHYGEEFVNTLIIGAGAAGHLLYKEVSTNSRYKNRVVGFVDDDPAKLGKSISGINVVGTSHDLAHLVETLQVGMLYVAMPSVALPIQKQIIARCYETKCKVQVLSSTEDMMSSSGIRNSLHDLNIEDLLGRGTIQLDNSALSTFIKDQVVLVTGAAGSIGSELARQIATYQPKVLVLLDINENGLYDLHQNFLMAKRKEPVTLVPLIVSIRERDELDTVFSTYKPDIVFHAAAHKHVPLMEDMPAEAVRNNIFGSLNLIECAIAHKVKRFVTISTDKAVNPTNVMGATKRFVEQIIQSIDPATETKFMAVRFGNVLGSNGSIIPLFKRQIENGGPLTLTHRDIIRYFMTIPEAVSLVLQAAVYAKGGEIFVLDMGQPVKILDLAEKMIRLAGYEPYVDIDIQEIGLRQGEKLFEELRLSKEEVTQTANELIFVTHPIPITPAQIQADLNALSACLQAGDDAIIETLQAVVPTYHPNRHVSKNR